MHTQDFYTIPEVAKLLRINEITVRRLVKKKELPAYQVGKLYRFRHSDLEEYLRSVYNGGQQPPSSSQPETIHKKQTSPKKVKKNQADWIDGLEDIELTGTIAKSTFSRGDMIMDRGV